MTDKERRVVLLDRIGFAKVGVEIAKGVEYWLRVTEEKQEERRDRKEERATVGTIGYKGIFITN